ncbi:hypothetical protein L7F22_045113 [Adiantum nelumboides]|nr:hypothetical protein [Adiantum nelumboides]
MGGQGPPNHSKRSDRTGASCLPSFTCLFLGWPSSKVGSLATPGSSSDDSSKDVLGLETPATPRTEKDVLSCSPLRKFSFNDLKSATRNFRPDSLLGEGGFGYVFKGWVEENGTAPVKPGTGLVVAVKILNPNGLQGHKEWLAEVHYLGEVQYKHLVWLVGYCSEGDQRLLVYEFMQRGSLENHLFRKGATPLAWTTRMKIAWGAAKGLAYLHNRKKPIIFRDFKTSNILLDLDYNAKLSDFGLARDGPQGDKTHVSTRVLGTYGYAAPEYVMTGHLTSWSDIYSFGVVLLEILTGKRSMDKTRPSGQHNLVEWARPFLNDKKKLVWLVDPRLNGEYSGKGFQKAARLAARCLCRDPKARPSMEEVLRILSPLRYPDEKSGFPVSAPPRDAKSRASVSKGGHGWHQGAVRTSGKPQQQQMAKRVTGGV